MPNIKLMESGLPVAPLKIGALESCRELGEKVNDYIVQFRKSTMDKNTDSPLYYNYLRDNVLEVAKQKDFLQNLSAEQICSLW